MSTLIGRSKTALLVVDVQQGVVGEAYEADRIVANVVTLVGRARTEDVPVIWVQHEDDSLTAGTKDWQIVDALRPDDGESLVAKSYGDSFEGTELEAILSAIGVERLIVTGAQTDACIRSTLHGALARGYDTTLVGDAHTTEDMREWGSPLSPEQAITYTNMYWSFTAAPGRTCATVDTVDVDFSSA